MLPNALLQMMVVAWAAMAQLASAGDVFSMLPMPLFAGTLGAVFSDIRKLSTSSTSSYHDAVGPPGPAGQSSIASTGFSSSSSSSSLANMLVDKGDLKIYADMYLYIQAAYYMVVLQAALLLAASMSVVAYIDALLLRAHCWLLESTSVLSAASKSRMSILSVMTRLLPSAGQVWQQILPSFKTWMSNMDLQQDDIVDMTKLYGSSFAYSTVYSQQLLIYNTYLPQWLCNILVIVAYWLSASKTATERPRQKARLAAALWLAAKLLCTFTDLPLPAGAPNMMMLLGLLSCLALEPSDENLDATFKAISKYCFYVLIWVFAWGAVAFHICGYLWRITSVPLKAVFRVMAGCVSAASRVSSWIAWLLVFVGAAEMSAASTVANWYRSQCAKLHLKYKYVRRIWRRTNGNCGAFVWQLLHGIEAGQGGSGGSSKASSSGKGGKNGSKAAALRRAGKPVSSRSTRLQETAYGEGQMSPVSSMNTGYSNSSSSSSDEEDASLAELLTLFPAATTKGNSNSKKSQSKVKAAPQGKQQSGRAAATTTAAPRTKQPAAAAAAAAKPSPASSGSNTGRPGAVGTGKGAAASSSKATASGMAGNVGAAFLLQVLCFLQVFLQALTEASSSCASVYGLSAAACIHTRLYCNAQR
jgi:hypothetical protein